MVSFVNFVLSFAKSDCKYGDVAKDMLLDKNISKRWNYKSLIYHLERCGASESVLNLIDDLNREYKNGVVG